MGGSADDLGFKLFDEQVSYYGTAGETHGCAMDLFIIPTLEEEICIFRQNSSKVVMCCMDKEVLPCSLGPVVIFV